MGPPLFFWVDDFGNIKHTKSGDSFFVISKSLKLTEITARDFAARKKIFREMATRSARIVSGDPAVRRRSLAPVLLVQCQEKKE